jgi:hypothetical protein
MTAYRKDIEQKIVALFTAGKSHAEIAEVLSTPDRPLIAAMVKNYMRAVAELHGTSRVAYEASLRKGKS